jgi:hypothetical protein
LTVFVGEEEVPSRAEVLRDRTIRREEALGVPGGFEPPHVPFPLARRLVGVFRPMVQVAVLPVFDARQELLLGRPVAFQPIGDDDPWHVPAAFEELAEKLLGGRLMTAPLHKDIQYTAVLIDRPPQIMASALNREKHLIEMPFVTWSGTPAPKLIRILLPKLAAPLANGFIGHRDPTREEQLFDIAITEAETEAQPDSMADNLGWEAVVLVAIDG